ncbi:hypothetical protein PK35_00450 [Tamlana nanhaiensis]|uniref:Secretion system C-terminal sorting domain-containing protein n=1 Tax=Neotamlana nanhaiensis TaxID=1382798 RepID=A0A0D7W6K4_9FLAO|nr:T9SS type A sorting domain-containing protein [Tamlana nanhaiensis]KJD34328.1 hypothetical protein PK35_00450 [Tamlana nanhaiensis]
MKKKLLLLMLPMLFASATFNAQIKYWDFGGKELGAGYDNMMPTEYINAVSNKDRNINWVDSGGTQQDNYADGVGYAPKSSDYANENGESMFTCYFYQGFLGAYANYATEGFQNLCRKRDTGVDGILISGLSSFTKPKLLPDLDANTNMTWMYDSTNDRIVTVKSDLTRYDERTEMPDDVDINEFSGCIQFTSPGEKRWDNSGGRGFSMNLQAGEYLTVVGSGQYTDIEGDGTLGFSTGTFQFATYGGTGTPVDITDSGTGTGNPNGPIDGSDTGDESVRVMEFQAVDAGSYILRNRGGKIRIYRMYVSSTSIKSQVEALLSVEDIKSKASTDIKAVGNTVYLSNVTAKTEVNIYSITGALVKSLKTDVDTDFEFQSGLWIATIKTPSGKKSVKFVTSK